VKEFQNPIPYYIEINDFLKDIPSEHRTIDPLFYCLRLKEYDTKMNNYKPPFRKDFYFVGLVTNAGKTKINYDETHESNLTSFLVFQSPGLLYSFFRDNTAKGYLIYFKADCFSFFKPDFELEFPFFNILHTAFFKFNQEKFDQFASQFEEVFVAYENSNDKEHTISKVKLLALLYQLKEYTTAFNQWEQGFTSPQQIMFQKFIRLVNNYYLEKRTIEEYADLLSVTANHLSQSIKLATGKNALSFISDRIMTEAKSIIQYSDFDIAEIAYQLNFTDPANFGKFFKKHANLTPIEFRKG
jgi:AraC-like DNA-binding protein